MKAFIVFAFAVLVAPLPAAAQSGSPAPALDILGIKPGMPMTDAIAALRAYNSAIDVEIRRVPIKKWDDCVGLGPAAAPSDCKSYGGNWPHGLNQVYPMHRAEQLKEFAALNPENSLVAGVVANLDQRVFKTEKPANVNILDEAAGHSTVSTYVSGNAESITLVVTPEPGAEKVVLVSRTKAYQPGTVLKDDIYGQLTQRYGPTFSKTAGENWRQFDVTVVNGRVVNGDTPRYRDCGGAAGLSATEVEQETVSAPLPGGAYGSCGLTLSATVLPHHANARYAASFSLVLVDMPALVALSRERLLKAKAMYDANAAKQPRTGSKEKL